MTKHRRPPRLWPYAVAAAAVGCCGLIAAATHAAPRVVAQPANPPPAAVVERYEVTDLVRLPVVASPSESEPVQDVAEIATESPVSAPEPSEAVRVPPRGPERRTEPLRVSTPQPTVAEPSTEAPAAARGTTATPKPAPTTQRSTPKPSPTAPAFSPTQEPEPVETTTPTTEPTPTATEPTRERPRWWERWERDQREDEDDE